VSGKRGGGTKGAMQSLTQKIFFPAFFVWAIYLGVGPSPLLFVPENKNRPNHIPNIAQIKKRRVIFPPKPFLLFIPIHIAAK